MADLNLDFLHSYSPLKRALILIAVIAVLVAAFVYFLYLPQLKIVAREEKKLKRAQVSLHQTQQITAQLPAFEAEKEKLDRAFKKALNRLPDNKDIPALLLKITKLGKDSKLTFNLFHPLAIKRKDFYAEVPIDIEVQGSYHAVGRFFSQICAMPRIVNIRNFSMGHYRQKEGLDILTAKFQAVTYTFVNKPAPKKKAKKKGRRRR
jgi:type IV pilus assembly protein PilO